jgi:hypothetical protein
MLALLLTVLLPTALPAPTRAQSAERCFSETGYCISGRIREEIYQTHRVRSRVCT